LCICYTSTCIDGVANILFTLTLIIVNQYGQFSYILDNDIGLVNTVYVKYFLQKQST